MSIAFPGPPGWVNWLRSSPPKTARNRPSRQLTDARIDARDALPDDPSGAVATADD